MEVIKKPKQFYKEVGLAEDPNKTIGSKKKKNNQNAKPKPVSKFVQELEQKAAEPRKKKFKFSKVMSNELDYYIERYKEDYNAMARDRKNIYQDSAGQLRYKIRKYLALKNRNN